MRPGMLVILLLSILILAACNRAAEKEELIRAMIEHSDSLGVVLQNASINTAPFQDGLAAGGAPLTAWSEYFSTYNGEYQLESHDSECYDKYRSNEDWNCIIRVHHSSRGYGADFRFTKTANTWALQEIQLFGTIKLE